MRKPKKKKKKTASDRKQSVSQNELRYLREYANNSVIAVFANRKLLGQ